MRRLFHTDMKRKDARPVARPFCLCCLYVVLFHPQDTCCKAEQQVQAGADDKCCRTAIHWLGRIVRAHTELEQGKGKVHTESLDKRRQAAEAAQDARRDRYGK